MEGTISGRFGTDPREWYRHGLLTDRDLVEKVGAVEAGKVFAETDPHSCPIGPLCDEWPAPGSYDDPRTGCDHNSCWAIVHEQCPACFEEIASAFREAERERDELVRAATCWCGRFGNAHDHPEDELCTDRFVWREGDVER